MNTTIVTTSWDDGHVLDVRLAALLAKYGVKGTLYVSPRDREIAEDKRLTDAQLRELSDSIEIGAHTMTHPRLPTVRDEEARREIAESKAYLEQAIGKPVRAFCYPGGAYRARHVRMVREVGFSYARTVRRHHFLVGSRFEGATTIHTYNHYTDLHKIARFAGFNPLRTHRYFQWDVLAKAMFDRVRKEGGVFHLWGHSWEIDLHNDWEKLEDVLRYISGHADVSYVTNSELVSSRQTALVVAPYFPPHHGGVERYVWETATRLVASGAWDVQVLTTSDTGRDEKEERDGLQVRRVGYTHMLSNSPFSFAWFRTVRRILAEVSPDIVHVHLPVPGLSDLVAFMLDMRVPLVLTYHAGSMRKGEPLLDAVVWLYEHTILPFVLARADRVACSSDFVRTGLLARVMHKSVTITPGVDTALFTPAQVSKKAMRPPTLLAVGGLGHAEKHKGLQRLIEMLPTIRARVPDVHLLVAGDGDERAMYEALVREKGLSTEVEFLGALQKADMALVYRRADVFVLPTTNDSFPTVILEAMASGVPVVATAVGSIPDMVQDGVTGYVVPPRDHALFAKRVTELLTDLPRAREWGARGSECARAFGWERSVSRYDALYREAIEKKPCIAQVVSYYPPHIGGMEMVAYELAHELARRGYPVRVFTSREGARHAPHTERSANLLVRRLAGFEFAHTPCMWTLPFRLLVLPRGSIIHVHLAQVLTPEIALLVAKMRGFRIVAQFHLDVDPSGALGWLFVWYKRLILPYVLRSMDAVMVFSDEQARFVVATYGVSETRVARVRNAVRDEFFHTRDVLIPHTPFRLLALSRLTAQKQVGRLIEAVALLSFPVQLTVIGNGEDRAELEERARTRCPDKVLFVGTKSHAEIREYQREADVFVIPSDKEGMPLSVLEAMAAGLPIVGSNVLGIRELVGGVGILVDDPSSETFAHALTELYHAPERLAELSRQSSACAEKYTWVVAADEVEAVYSISV